MGTVEAPAPDQADAREVTIEARGLVKRFGSRVALRGLSFEARRGEMLAVIGPNGAGKTTLLAILAGIERADAGEVSRRPSDVGWVPQHPAVYRRLSVRENLRLFARLERVEDVDGTVERMLELTALSERADDPVGDLSGGNQQRVNIAIGLISDPPVLLLDEPSSSLDPRQRERLWRFVTRLSGDVGTTVVFTTHDVAEAERYGDRLLVVADGEALLHGTVAELRTAVADDAEAAGDPPPDEDFESAFVAFLRHRGH